MREKYVNSKKKVKQKNRTQIISNKCIRFIKLQSKAVKYKKKDFILIKKITCLMLIN